MPYRIYQGKEIRTSDLIILPRGEIQVDIDTLEARIGDGATPGGIPFTATGTGGGGSLVGGDGGSASTVYDLLSLLDGGASATVYDNSQLALDGGNA